MSGFEIIGAVAAAGQFVEQGLKIAKLGHTLYRQVKDGPEEIRQRMEQLESLQAVATRIQTTRSLQTPEAEKILLRCSVHAETLLSRLKGLDFESEDSLQTKTWRAICSLNQEKEIIGLFAALDDEKSTLNLHISALISETAEATSESVKVGFLSLESKLGNLERASNPASNKQKCLQDLFTTDPADDRAALKTKKGDIVQGTCDWILEKAEFKEWQASKAGLLWISGGPGMGKTMLSVYLTEHGQLDLAQPKTESVLLYFFCDFTDNLRNSPMCIIRSLVFQLLKAKEDLGRHIFPAYDIQREKLFQPSSFETLWKILVTMLQSLRECQVVCVLDGLDECEPESLQLLLPKLGNVTKTDHGLKLVVTSREHPRCLKHFLGEFPRVRLDPDAKCEIKTGLQKYIETRLAELSQVEQYPVALRQHVEKVLHDRSERTYLWASFAVEGLRSAEVSDVEAYLDGLPAGLEPLYERMLQQVEPKQQDLVRNILRWCALAMRPLNLDELIFALTIQATEALTPVEVLRGKLGHCGHLANISDKVTLVHQSVYDFLTRAPSHREDTPWFSLHDVAWQHAELTSICLSYAELFYQHISKNERFPSWSTPGGGLLFYGMYNWDHHFRLSAHHASGILKDHPGFFSDSSPIFDMYFRTGFTTLGRNFRSRSSARTPEFNRLELVAAHLGLDALMVDLLKGKIAVLRRLKNKRRARILGTTPLHLAAEEGHLSIVEMLRNETPLNIRDRFDKTPLERAIIGGHTAVVQCLVQSGADVSVGRTLEHAISGGKVEVVKLVLAGSPCITVADLGHAARVPIITETTKDSLLALLLPLFIRQKAKKAGAWGKLSALRPSDPNGDLDLTRADSDGWTALDYVAEGCSSAATMGSLLQQLTMDLSPEKLMGPLKQALQHADIDVVRLFVDEHHAQLPVVASSGEGRGAIHYAAADQDHDRALQKLRFLIKDRNMDPNSWTTGNDTETAMSIAIERYNMDAVRFLVNECNVDPEAICQRQGGCGSRPIHAAVLSESVETILMLVDEMKVDVNGLTDESETPLHWVMSYYPFSEGLLRRLLAAGADINIKDINGRTPRDVVEMPHLAAVYDRLVEEHSMREKPGKD